ncbi:hypothetical protein HYV85_03235 [Candidatus Woesearchaeota archaeon]|nr:hypothetical protein [Candidatus Woesearchaeota archaeon]
MKKNGRRLGRAYRNAVRKFVSDLNRAAKDMIKAGINLSELLVPKAAVRIHKRLGSIAARVDRISSAHSKLR